MRSVQFISAVLLLLISLIYVHAQESYPLSIVIEQRNKPEEVIALKDIQKISFAEGQLQMHYTSEVGYAPSFACQDVIKCTFSTSKRPTALPIIAAPSVSSYKLLSDGQNIYIEGLVAGQCYTVALYDMCGNRMYQRFDFVAGDAIGCAMLPKGIYVVHIDDETYRVVL